MSWSKEREDEAIKKIEQEYSFKMYMLLCGEERLEEPEELDEDKVVIKSNN